MTIQDRLTELLYSVAAQVDTGDPPEGYDSDPEMNGTASPGSSDNYARGDHVHPSDTSRMDIADGIILVSKTISSLPTTISNSAIKADHVALDMVLGTPTAQLDDWTFTTSAGSLTISGTISGSTSMKLVLGRKGN